MMKVVIYREMRDPDSGKFRLLQFIVEVRDLVHLREVLKDIDARYPREGAPND